MDPQLKQLFKKIEAFDEELYHYVYKTYVNYRSPKSSVAKLIGRYVVTKFLMKLCDISGITFDNIDDSNDHIISNNIRVSCYIRYRFDYGYTCGLSEKDNNLIKYLENHYIPYIPKLEHGNTKYKNFLDQHLLYILLYCGNYVLHPEGEKKNSKIVYEKTSKRNMYNFLFKVLSDYFGIELDFRKIIDEDMMPFSANENLNEFDARPRMVLECSSKPYKHIYCCKRQENLFGDITTISSIVYALRKTSDTSNRDKEVKLLCGSNIDKFRYGELIASDDETDFYMIDLDQNEWLLCNSVNIDRNCHKMILRNVVSFLKQLCILLKDQKNIEYRGRYFSIFHRKLSPYTIIVNKSDDPDTPFTPRIFDFSCAKLSAVTGGGNSVNIGTVLVRQRGNSINGFDAVSYFENNEYVHPKIRGMISSQERIDGLTIEQSEEMDAYSIAKLLQVLGGKELPDNIKNELNLIIDTKDFLDPPLKISDIENILSKL